MKLPKNEFRQLNSITGAPFAIHLLVPKTAKFASYVVVVLLSQLA